MTITQAGSKKLEFEFKSIKGKTKLFSYDLEFLVIWKLNFLLFNIKKINKKDCKEAQKCITTNRNYIYFLFFRLKIN